MNVGLHGNEAIGLYGTKVVHDIVLHGWIDPT